MCIVKMNEITLKFYPVTIFSPDLAKKVSKSLPLLQINMKNSNYFS